MINTAWNSILPSYNSLPKKNSLSVQELSIHPKSSFQSVHKQNLANIIRFGMHIPDNEDGEEAKYKYTNYTPDNVPSPLSTYHSLFSPQAWVDHKLRGDALKNYKSGYRGTIPWVNEERPIDTLNWTVFDTETTGLDFFVREALRNHQYSKLRQRLVQLAASITEADPQHRVIKKRDFNELINPGHRYDPYRKHRPGEGEGEIPFKVTDGAASVHGISTDQVTRSDVPTLFDPIKDITNGMPILQYFRSSNLKSRPAKERGLLGPNNLGVAYNASFDIAYLNKFIDLWNKNKALTTEYGKLEEMDPTITLDPFILIQRIHPFVTLEKTLGAHYRVLMGEELEGAHDAMVDVHATVDVLKYVTRYLQKHTIPLEWSKFAYENLPDEIKTQPTPDATLAFIARSVRENRELFELAFPGTEEEALTAKDILFFQHGFLPTHWNVSPSLMDKLPRLDITLNMFGWDGKKRWDQLSSDQATWDTLEKDLVNQIRHERGLENGNPRKVKRESNSTAPLVDEGVKIMLKKMEKTRAQKSKKADSRLSRDTSRYIPEVTFAGRASSPPHSAPAPSLPPMATTAYSAFMQADSNPSIHSSKLLQLFA